jgi:transcriptional regulator with XRE-family HTH domain
MRQSDLAKRAGVSKAAVSNALNPDRGAPSHFTLEQLTGALEIGGEQRRELYGCGTKRQPTCPRSFAPI